MAPSLLVTLTSLALGAASLVSALSNSTASNTTSIGSHSVQSTILVLARNSADSYTCTAGLNAHGIPYQAVIVPSSGIVLPTLNSSATQGLYGGIIINGEVSYEYSGGWASALTSDQFTQLYNYQAAFGVRMIRLNVYPGSTVGTNPLGGCCGTGVEQLVSITNATGLSSANIKVGATLSTQGLWHYPATIADPSTTWEVAGLGPASDGSYTGNSSVAVVNQFGARQQMVFFTSLAIDWSTTSNYLQHIWIHWMTRGLFTGHRRIYLSTQVDDVHLATALYQPSNYTFRVRPADLNAHVSWMRSINSRLPTGSNYTMELAHNGNGDIANATQNAGGAKSCTPDTYIYYNAPATTPLEYYKPLGSGTDVWPTTPANYTWSETCATLDPLALWFSDPTNRDSFAHLSHTFTHLSLDNATYSDANKEMYFNAAWMKQIGLSSATRFSAHGLVPPAIMGMHNGDAIQAWADNGVTAVVGDNTRPVLLNTNNEYYALTSTVASNGYAGMIIMPRWATTIYFNCDLPACTLNEWVTTSAGVGPFSNLLNDARATNVRHLLGLRHDPFMFHQANLRQADVDPMTVGDQTGQLSLLQIWVETVLQEMMRLTNWPVLTLKHDDLANEFLNRQARDACSPSLAYNYNADGSKIVSVTLSANGNTCPASIPVSFPGTATTTAKGTVNEKYGADPLIIWTSLNGQAVTFKLGEDVTV